MPAPTAQQRAAIEADGNVLVMAGAGTGKTATMVARVLERVCRPDNPIPLDRILMVTFTEKAAGEMRSRLRSELERQMAAPAGMPELGQIAEQLLLLDRASIGTLHSVCLGWVRENAGVLGLDPGFRVADDIEMWRLREESLEAAFSPIYTGTDDLAAASRNWLIRYYDSDEGRARETVRRVYAYMRSLADPAEWLAGQRAMWSGEEPSAWLSALEPAVVDWAEGWHERLRLLSPVNSKAAECLDVMAPANAADYSRKLWAETTGQIVDAAAEWQYRKKSQELPAVEDLFEEAEFLHSILMCAEGAQDPIIEDWNLVRRQMLALVETVIRYDDELTRRKKQAALVDFNDLEQLVLKLLRESPGQIGAELRGAYDLVFVDEYQDINGAQDAILRLVAKPSPDGNRFLVGDLKQSIYRFRLADPHVFQDYASEWGGEATPGRVLTLTENFRSAEAILGFVNGVFRSLFEGHVSGFNYNDETALRFGNAENRAKLAVVATGPRIEVMLRLTGGDHDAPEARAGATAIEIEAAAVAQRLAGLRRDEFQVWDREKAGFRAVEWGDMVVLLRSPASKADAFARELAAQGIPVALRCGGFLDQLEVRDLWNLLRILDNPLQDLPVASVLRSPLAGLRDVNDLARIRLADREKTLWEALRTFAAPAPPAFARSASSRFQQSEFDFDAEPPVLIVPDPDPAVVKARLFLERYDRWRESARRGPVSGVLEEAIEETLYEALIATDAGAGLRQENVRRFVELAHAFERSSAGGLSRFLGYLDDRAASDPGGATEDASQADAVQILSIHASKGLEFPVTVVASLGSPFNERDQRGDIVLDDQLGIAPLIVTPAGASYPSVALWLANRVKRREMLAEEMRLLYVAFTRACDLLILAGTASVKRAESDWSRPLDRHKLETARSPLHWLGPAFAEMAGDPDWHQKSEGTADTFVWRAINPAQSDAVEPVESNLEAEPVPATPAASRPNFSEAEMAGILARFQWRYPHSAATREGAKAGVTALRKRYLEETADEAKVVRSATPPMTLARDGTLVNRSGAAERGTLHHLFLEHVNLRRPCTKDDLELQMAEMVRDGRLSADQAKILDIDGLADFWGSRLGQSIRARADSVRREWPFTLGMRVRDLSALSFDLPDNLDPEEYIVVQGVVDLAVVMPKEIWLLDFKTDGIKEAGVKLKAEEYRVQLAIYAQALEKILGPPVTQRWLRFLTPRVSLRVG